MLAEQTWKPKMRPLNILTYAYVFPPDAGSGTYRTLYFTNHWAKSGDAITVITVREGDFAHSAIVDRMLCGQIEPSVEVVRAKAHRPLERLIALRAKLMRKRFSAPSYSAASTEPARFTVGVRATVLRRTLDFVSTLLTFPDEHSGWIVNAIQNGRRLVRRHRFDCIYASGGPWSCLVAAATLQRLTRLPLILDFRDPWASSPNFKTCDPWLRRLHERCEAFCVRSARRIITNTEELRADFVARYPQIDSARFLCVTNGFEELPPAPRRERGRFTLTHAGALYLSRNPRHFLQAYAELLTEGTIARADAHLQFVGGVPVEDPHVAALLQTLGSVVEIFERLPHAEALRLQREAAGLLLFQAGLPLQVPRKLYEYLSLRLPILAVTDTGGATARILSDLDLRYVAEDDVAAIKAALLRMYIDWKQGALGGAAEDKLQRYSNRNLASKVRSAMLDSIHQTNPGTACREVS